MENNSKSNRSTSKLEEAYNNIDKHEELIKQQSAQLEAAKKQLTDLEEMNKRSNEQIEIEALRRQLEEKDKVIKEYQDLNQKLFLKVGMPVDEKPEEQMMSSEERAFKEQLAELDKRIKEQNEKPQQ